MNKNSRTARWARALDEARSALGEAQSAAETLQSALSDLSDLKDEYQEWLDNLPENLQGSAVAEKLEAVCGLYFDWEPDFSEVENLLDEAEGVELPMGFGRD